MSGAVLEKETLQGFYTGLMSVRRGYPVEDALARMLSSLAFGEGNMPEWLGLDEREFSHLMHFHFPGYPYQQFSGVGDPLDLSRLDESDDLRRLLLKSRSGVHDYEIWLADILVAGCLGNDHLWQDLGLWSRVDLSRFIADAFQPLALANDRDMKWKKFLYKQLCAAEGIYVCRSPSCEVCADYGVCFGPED